MILIIGAGAMIERNVILKVGGHQESIVVEKNGSRIEARNERSQALGKTLRKP